MASNGQQMKRHIPDCGKPKKGQEKKHSKGGKMSKVLGSPKSGHKSKKGKKDSEEGRCR